MPETERYQFVLMEDFDKWGRQILTATLVNMQRQTKRNVLEKKNKVV